MQSTTCLRVILMTNNHHYSATSGFNYSPERNAFIHIIQERGRWSTDKARKIYIQSTRSHAIQLQIPTKLANTAHTLTTNILAIFAPFIKKL